MALLTRREFTDIYGVKNAHISTYADRLKLVLSEDKKTIDTTNPVNKTFIDNLSKKKGAQVPNAGPPKPDNNSELDDSDDDSDVSELAKNTNNKKLSRAVEKAALEKLHLNSEKQKADLRKKQLDADKVQLEIDKLQGNNINVEIVKQIISNFSKAFITNYKSYSDQLINEVAHEFGVPNDDRVRFLSKLTNQLNMIHSKSVGDAKRHFQNAIGQTKLDLNNDSNEGS